MEKEEVIAQSTTQNQGKLKRDMKMRHLLMIAFGGAIGTGLFVGTGGNIASAGPLGTLIAYCFGGLVVYCIMLSLGELASFYPTTGSFGDYAAKFIGPSTGYMVFWMYWLGWVITVALEYIAIGMLMQRWFPTIPIHYWVIICILLVFLLNFFSVKIFAEGEFVFSLIKVIAVVAFISIGVIGIIYQIYLNGFSSIFNNFYFGDKGFFPNGSTAVFSAMLAVIFAFTGTEVIGVAVGETKNASEVMPKAIKATLWRIVFFFLGSVFVISVFLPMNDSTITQSPFVSVLERINLPFVGIGIPYVADIMNAVIITAMFSTANSGLYGASRMIYGLSQQDMFFKLFSKLNKQGTPINAMYFSIFFSLIGLLTQVYAKESIVEAFINVISFTVIIVWVSVSVSQYAFRRQYLKAGHSLDDLPYKAPFLPFLQFVGITGCIIGVIGSAMDKEQRIGMILTLIFAVICYIGYHFTQKTKQNKKNQRDLI
ncbi:amino acid permease [Helicobacter cetorum]|uniref:Amino acid permease n=1 Tax=Helicobacter cetorum (strain ATCC BAA-429 / MIT 00-7128) TaxID=182217 RepID=I0EM46_HELC0|nr:amino acid permease [Helicobacter cetorum]AFI04015.1 amino acid permease [Helicobacter cetorum MIT 00-7128]